MKTQTATRTARTLLIASFFCLPSWTAAVQVETAARPGAGPLLVPLLQNQPLLRADLKKRASGITDAAGAQSLFAPTEYGFSRDNPPSVETTRALRVEAGLQLLLVRPELLNEDPKILNGLIDYKNIQTFKKLAQDLARKAKAEPESAFAQRYAALKAKFDAAAQGGPEQVNLTLNAVMDNARAVAAEQTAAVIAAAQGSGAPALAKATTPSDHPALAVPSPKSAMTASELEAFIADKTSVSNVGLKVVRLPAGSMRPEYEAMLKALGVDVLMIMEPSARELDSMQEDKGWFLRSESYRWVSKAMRADDFLGTVSQHAKGGLIREIDRSAHLGIDLGPMTEERFAEWYPLYVQEIGGRPGGQVYVKPDLAAKEKEKNGLKPWWTVYYRDRSDGRMVGGINMKEWADRKMLWGHYAAYDKVTKPFGMSVRSFLESLNLTHFLGYPVMSMGLDLNLRGFYRSIGLLLNKSRLRASIYPEEEITLTKILNVEKYKEEKNNQGQNEGLVFFSLPRGGVVETRYREALGEGRVAKAEELLGGDYFSKEIVPAGLAMVMRHFFTEPDMVLNPPTGFEESVVRQPLDSLKDL